DETGQGVMLGQRERHEDWLEMGRDVGPQRRSPVRITLLTKRSAAPRTCGTWISSTPLAVSTWRARLPFRQQECLQFLLDAPLQRQPGSQPADLGQGLRVR